MQRKTALSAPRSAVLPGDDNKQVLFTVKDNKAVKHEVQTGIASADQVEVIAKDLKAGDSVVTLCNYELDDGMAVAVAAPEAKAADAAEPAGAAKAGDEKGAEAPKPEAKP